MCEKQAAHVAAKLEERAGRVMGQIKCDESASIFSQTVSRIAQSADMKMVFTIVSAEYAYDSYDTTLPDKIT